MKLPPLPRLSEFTMYFSGFTTIDELEFFYNKRFQNWLYNYSHEKDRTVKDKKIIFSLKFDEKGNIVNANFSGTTKDGIPLTEKDFIKHQLYHLDRLIPSQMTFDENKKVEYYRDFLHKKMENIDLQKEDENTEKGTNPYPEVFKSLEAYLLFDRLYSSTKDSNTLLADFSFIYRRMSKDQLLQEHQKPEVFRQWLSKEPYNLVLDNKFKTLDNCTTRIKEQSYQDTKDLVQKQTE